MDRIYPTIRFFANPLLALGVLLAAMPFVGGYAESPHNFNRLLQIFVLFCGSVVWARLAWSGPSAGWHFQSIAVAVLILGGGISCGVADMPLVAFREWALFLGSGVLVLAISRCAFWRDALQQLTFIKLLLFGAFLHACSFFVLLLAVLLRGDELRPWDLVMGFDNPRLLNHVQVLLIPILVGSIGRLKEVGAATRLWSTLSWFAVGGQFCIVAVTFGRSAGVALAIAAVFARMLFGRRVDSILRGHLKGVAVGALLYILFMYVGPRIAGAGAGGGAEPVEVFSDHSRLFLWREAFSLFLKSPLWGVGPMHLAHFPNRAGAHPHNIYIQMIAEWGIFCGLVAILLLLSVMRRAAAVIHERDEGCFPVAVFVACAGALVDGLFSGNFVMPNSQLWLALSFGLLVNITREPIAMGLRMDAPPLVWRVVLVSIVMVQVWFFIQSLGEFKGSQTTMLGATPPPNIGSLDRPRFWRKGWF